MSTSHTARRDLGDGLVARWSTAADTEGVAALFGHVFREGPESPINTVAMEWIRDEMSGRHPLVGPNDTALVEDTRRGTIVSASVYMRQQWEYAGIPVALGRTEPVATHEDYRGRGLVRATFDLCHQRSDERGDLAQCITGIEYFYRQFGYEYAVELGGSRSVYLASVPPLKEGEQEKYRLRQAGLPDTAQVMMLYERERTLHRGGQPVLVTAKMDTSYLQWTLDGQNPAAGEGLTTYLIERVEDGQAVGYVRVGRMRWRAATIGIGGLMTEPSVPLTAVMPAVLRALKELAPQVPVSPSGKPGEPVRIGLWLGKDHPAHDAIGRELAVAEDPPYAYYVRVPDLPRFMHHIAPALDRRLSGSSLSGYTGELKLDFYRDGLRLEFERGKLKTAEPWRRPVWGDPRSGGFPPLVFLQLMFGRRSLDELRYAFPDVWANDEASMLLNTLFPKQPSWIANLV
ncbi:MAG: hypothetical protein RLZZ387_4325 [Chloroflexota bacterium]